MRKILSVLVPIFMGVLTFIGVLFTAASSNVDVPLEVAKGLINLAIAILVTGGLSYFLSDRARKQAEVTEVGRLLVGVMQDLKSAHETVQVVQFRLNADCSPMRLREQIEVLIEVRANLQRLRHERLIRDDVGAYGEIKRMTNYIRALAEEYAANLPTTSELITTFERDTQQYLQSKTDHPPAMPKLEMQQFKELQNLLNDERFRNGQFYAGYMRARLWIENKLSQLRYEGRVDALAVPRSPLDRASKHLRRDPRK
ncbi:hypothetical protein [Amycolatopsis sp. NPDC051371]|uniref:hypothetical protein n=1 Tax=Amycolatopsis sp. NPDC051371 TaxID=3155800 RepID=UPI00343A41B1